MAWKKLITRKEPFISHYLILLGLRDYLKESLGWGFNNRLDIFRKGNVDIYDRIEEIEELKETWQKRIKKPNFLLEFFREYLKLANNLLSISKRIYSEDLKSASPQKLYRLYLQFCHSYASLTRYMNSPFIIEGLLTPRIQEWLKNKLEKKNQTKKLADYFVSLSQTNRAGFAAQQEIEFMGIVAEILARPHVRDTLKGNSLVKLEKKLSQVDPEINLRLEAHLEKYKHLPIINEEEPWDKRYFVGLLSKVISQKVDAWEKLVELESYPRKIALEQSNLASKLRFSPQIEIYLEILREMAYIKDWRRNIFNLSHYLSRPLFGEIGKRANLTRLEIKYLTPDEVKRFLIDGKLTGRKEIKKRMEYCLVWLKQGNIGIYLGKEAKEIEKKEISKEQIDYKVKIIKGTPTSPGNVIGIVNLIREKK